MVCVFDEPRTDVAVLPGDLEADLLRRELISEGISGGVERGVRRGGREGEGGLLGDGVEGTGDFPWLPPLDSTSGDTNLSLSARSLCLSAMSLCTGSLVSSSAEIFWATAVARSFSSSNP